MSEMSKKARADMRAKAIRLTSTSNDPHKRVDGSSWEPTEALNADRKTGARPVRPRIYRNHGGPVAIQKDRGPQRADRKVRVGSKAYGDTVKTVAAKLTSDSDAMSNSEKDQYARNYATWRSKRADGGRADTPGAESTIDTAGANKAAFGSYHTGGYKKGGRAARKNGGKAATINIVIAGGGPKPDPMQQGPQGPIKPMPPPMPPPGPMAGGPPPGGPPPMPPGGPPMPMGRKDGGPVMHYGAGGGEGRLEKIALQKRSKRASGGMTAGAGSGEGRLQKIKLQERVG